jgi:hypothetical protein
MQDNYLKTLKSDIEKLDFNSFGLLGSNGKWILRPNSGRNGSNLDRIFTMLETLPPDNYRVYCGNVGRNKDAGFEYQVCTTTMQTAPNVYPQFGTGPFSSDERFSKLERDNAILLERLATLSDAITNLAESNDDDDDDDDDDDFGLSDEPTPTERAVELLAPAIPQVIDRVLSFMDVMIERQRGGGLANGAEKIAHEPLQIDYDLLSKMVADKLRNEYDPV